MKKNYEIGLISDTHGLLRPEATLALAGCDLILHAGDVGDSLILTLLNEIAPTTAVLGNVDDDPLPQFYFTELGGVKILMYHGHLSLDEHNYNPDIIITGHSHIPHIEQDNHVLRVNPGSAGPRRFKLPVTVARLTITHSTPSARLIHLDIL